MPMIFFSFTYTSFFGITNYVPKTRQKICLIRNNPRIIAILKKMPRAIIFPIKIYSILAAQIMHKHRHIRPIAVMNQQMKMIIHQTISANVNLMLNRHQMQSMHKDLVIHLILKNNVLTHTPISYMQIPSFIINSSSFSHKKILPFQKMQVKYAFLCIFFIRKWENCHIFI